MRYCCFLLLVFLAACGGQSETQTTDSTIKNEDSVVIPTATDNPGIQYFTGTVNNKIPVFLWLRTDSRDSVLEGAVIYGASKSKRPIRLLGTLGGADRVLMEYLPDGQISGMWAGRITEGSFKGIWSDPGSEKEYNFLLDRVDTTWSGIPQMAGTGNITGSYEYNYPKEGAMGSLNVRLLDPAHIVCNIDANIGAPSYNMAMTGEDTLELKGNTAIHHSVDEFGTCTFRIRFFGDFAVIDYPSGEYDCGFGHNANVEGLFIKTGKTYQKSLEEGQ